MARLTYRRCAVDRSIGRQRLEDARLHASIAAMRCCVWMILGSLGCGSVANGKLPDAGPGGDGPGNDGPPMVPPGTIRWVRSLSSMEGLGVADGPGGLTVAGAISAPANVGGQALVPAGGFDMVVAGFDAETADHVFSVRHGDVGGEFGFLHHEDFNGAPMVRRVLWQRRPGPGSDDRRQPR